MRKIVLATGLRGEYGYIRPTVREIERHSDLDYSYIIP